MGRKAERLPKIPIPHATKIQKRVNGQKYRSWPQAALINRGVDLAIKLKSMVPYLFNFFSVKRTNVNHQWRNSVLKLPRIQASRLCAPNGSKCWQKGEALKQFRCNRFTFYLPFTYVGQTTPIPYRPQTGKYRQLLISARAVLSAASSFRLVFFLNGD